MGRVWGLIRQHQDGALYGASVRSIASAAGVSHTMLSKWQDIKRLPEPAHLQAVARQIGVPYRVLLEAALIDAGYLPDERQDNRDGASKTHAAVSAAEDQTPMRRAKTPRTLKTTAPTRKSPRPHE